MPSGPRIKSNNVFGVISDNPLTIGSTSFNSASLFLLPAVSSAHAVVVLDPKRVFGEPEIVVVTAHTALATVATIIRGTYGTTARAHSLNSAWAHVVVTDDMVPIVTSSTRPTDPYEGQYIYETDTHRPTHRDNTQWLPGGPVSVVTSGTRPANPYEGQYIYETDTDVILVWTGTLWQELTSIYRDETAGAWTAGTSFSTTGASIIVPAGKWVIESWGYFDWSEGTARTKQAEIFNNTASTQLAFTECLAATNGKMPFHLTGTANLTVTSTLQLRARVNTVDGTQLLQSAGILARPVSALL